MLEGLLYCAFTGGWAAFCWPRVRFVHEAHPAQTAQHARTLLQTVGPCNWSKTQAIVEYVTMHRDRETRRARREVGWATLLYLFLVAFILNFCNEHRRLVQMWEDGIDTRLWPNPLTILAETFCGPFASVWGMVGAALHGFLGLFDFATRVVVLVLLAVCVTYALLQVFQTSVDAFLVQLRMRMQRPPRRPHDHEAASSPAPPLSYAAEPWMAPFPAFAPGPGVPFAPTVTLRARSFVTIEDEAEDRHTGAVRCHAQDSHDEDQDEPRGSFARPPRHWRKQPPKPRLIAAAAGHKED